ncbi:MAG: hypothetical protein WBL93_14585 [Lutisporaceae bacterium]
MSFKAKLKFYIAYALIFLLLIITAIIGYLDSNFNVFSGLSLSIATIAIIYNIYRNEEIRVLETKKRIYKVAVIKQREKDKNFANDIQYRANEIIASKGIIEEISINLATGFVDNRKEAYIIYYIKEK